MTRKKARPTANDQLERMFYPEETIAFLDAEFNAGMDPRTREKISEIISIGIVICDKNYNGIKKYYTLVSPLSNTKIFPVISNMTGITTEMLEGQPTFAEMSVKLTELIKKYDVKKIYTWGASDKHSLLLEKDEWKEKKMSGYQGANKWSYYMELCTDISGLVSGQMLGIRGGLTINMENLMFFCEIEDRQEHNALSDAFYLYKSMQYLRDFFPAEKQDEFFHKKKALLDSYYQDRSMYNSFRRFRCSTKGCDLYRKWGKKKYEDDIRLKAFADDLKFLKGEIPYDLEFDTIQAYFEKNGETE
jgi:hypothetical protein